MRRKYILKLNLHIFFKKVQTDAPDIHKVEQSMQVELSVQDKSLQTSPRDEYSKPEKQKIPTLEIVPHVAENLVHDIVRGIQISIPTETQGTSTDIVKTNEGITQTTPRNEVSNVEATPSDESLEPYEIHIQTSFLVPDATTINTAENQSSPIVLEIQKSFVIDETQPGMVREIESTSQEKVKKSKSKKKKKKSQKNDSEQPDQIALVDQALPVDVGKSSERVEAPEKKAFATLKITKTTVYETSNLISKERHPDDSSVTIEELVSDENAETPFTQGNGKYSRKQEQQ